MQHHDTAIFDLGGVLIDWNPRHLYRKLFDDEQAMEHFLANVCTMAWHVQHDAGRPFAETAAELKREHSGYDDLIDAFGIRQDEMMGGAIAGTVALLERLAAAGVPLYAITNFPSESFPAARRKFPFLALFRDIAVSGHERVVKPEAELFHRLLRRNAIAPGRAVFIDDSMKNIDTARTLGLHAIHFTSPEALERKLISLGVLPEDVPTH